MVSSATPSACTRSNRPVAAACSPAISWPAWLQAVAQLEKQDAAAARELCELARTRLPHALLLQQRMASLQSLGATGKDVLALH